MNSYLIFIQSMKNIVTAGTVGYIGFNHERIIELICDRLSPTRLSHDLADTVVHSSMQQMTDIISQNSLEFQSTVLRNLPGSSLLDFATKHSTLGGIAGGVGTLVGVLYYLNFDPINGFLSLISIKQNSNLAGSLDTVISTLSSVDHTVDLALLEIKSCHNEVLLLSENINQLQLKTINSFKMLQQNQVLFLERLQVVANSQECLNESLVEGLNVIRVEARKNAEAVLEVCQSISNRLDDSICQHDTILSKLDSISEQLGQNNVIVNGTNTFVLSNNLTGTEVQSMISNLTDDVPKLEIL